MAIAATFRPAIRSIVYCLVTRQFHLLEEDGRIGRLTKAELAEGIDEYGRTLTELPEQAWDFGDTFELQGNVNAWTVDVNLWTEEEGRSDLTLSLAIFKLGDGSIFAKIEDLHVL